MERTIAWRRRPWSNRVSVGRRVRVGIVRERRDGRFRVVG
jgi:hypothetical protein